MFGYDNLSGRSLLDVPEIPPDELEKKVLLFSYPNGTCPYENEWIVETFRKPAVIDEVKRVSDEASTRLSGATNRVRDFVSDRISREIIAGFVSVNGALYFRDLSPACCILF